MTDDESKHTKALILCAGECTRWNDYLGIPKQLITVCGESLLTRMIRLLNSHGYYDIDIVSNDERLQQDSCGFFRPEKTEWTVETLLSTQSLWGDQTVVLLGDVFFSENAIEKVVKSRNGIHFYGRPGASKFTYAPSGEIFAMSIEQPSRDQAVRHAEIVRDNASLGGRGKLWELYRSIAGFPLNQHLVEGNIFIVVNDFTDDIDTPAQYVQAVKHWECICSNQRVRILGLTIRLSVRWFLKNGEAFLRLYVRRLKRLLKLRQR